MWNLPRTGLTLLMRRRSLFPELKRPLLACSKKDSPFSFFLFVAGIAFVTIWELLPSAIVMKIFYLIITTFFLPLNLAATGTLRGPPDEAEELQELEGLTTIELEDQDEEAKHLRSRRVATTPLIQIRSHSLPEPATRTATMTIFGTAMLTAIL
jgi:hypothetical protein